MTPLQCFPPRLEAAHARIAAVSPADYARSRNAIDGAVSRLSPYISHGMVELPEVLAGVASRHRLGLQHKFVFELGWREYFQHVWHHRGDAILASLHPGVLPDAAYATELPADIRQARTGVPVVDQAVRTLYATGHLHNHARMWLASYVVHLRKLHWRAGADWMLAHLLDGDLASNHLSWQWVAGTASHKPYLFNADNVARHAPAAWHSPGSVVDRSYDDLEALARSPLPVAPHAQTQALTEGTAEPALTSHPPCGEPPRASDVAGRDVWLVHPWALGEPPADLPHGCLRLGWWPSEAAAAWAWNAARWAFVAERMSALTALQWQGSGAQLGAALASARSVQTRADGHVAAWLPPCVAARQPLRLFAEVDRACTSFSTWWKHSTRHLISLSDLPGLQALAALASTGRLAGP